MHSRPEQSRLIFNKKYTRFDKKIRAIFVFLKKLLFIFININFVPFKVIPIRYNTLVPALFPIFEALLKPNFLYSV